MTSPDEFKDIAVPYPEADPEKRRVVLSVSFNYEEWKKLHEAMDAAGANATPKTHISTYVKQKIFGKS